MVKRLLGSYPSLNLHDPETYMANLVTLLTGYPLWAGERAVGTVRRQTRFPPTEAELYPALEDQVKVHRYAENWHRDAEVMVAERLLPAPTRVKETYEQLKARYGPTFGISQAEAGRPRHWKTLDELRAEYGADVVDAVPDAKGDTWKRPEAPVVPALDETTRTGPDNPARPLEAAAE